MDINWKRYFGRLLMTILALSLLCCNACYADEMQRGYFEGIIPVITILPDTYVSQNFVINGKQVSVSFNMHDGYMPDEQFVYGDAKADNKKLKLRLPAKDGYSCYGWYYEADGKSIKVKALNKKLFKDTDHISLTARYNSLKYNIVFKRTNPDSNTKAEGKGLKIKNVTYDEKIKLGDLFTAPNYRVIGWSRDKNSTRPDKGFEVGSVVSALSKKSKHDANKVVLYPVWEAGDQNQEPAINNGNYAVLRLSTNPSTGYGWEIKQSEELFDIKREMKRLAPPDIVGAAEEEIITLKPVKAGEVKVTFSYCRSWENKPAIETLIYTFAIDDNLRITLNGKEGYNADGKSISKVPDVEMIYVK